MIAELDRDTEFLDRLAAGDPLAYGDIMTEYRPVVTSIARRYLRNEQDVEEIVQDAFVNAFRHILKFRKHCKLRTWICTIASNLALNRYGYWRRRKLHLTDSIDYEMGDTALTLRELLADESPTPRQGIVQGEFAKMVMTAFELVPETHRKAIYMRAVQNLEYQEIADLLGIGMGTVKSRISRGRESLRANLLEACPELSADKMNQWLADTL